MPGFLGVHRACCFCNSTAGTVLHYLAAGAGVRGQGGPRLPYRAGGGTSRWLYPPASCSVSYMVCWVLCWATLGIIPYGHPHEPLARWLVLRLGLCPALRVLPVLYCAHGQQDAPLHAAHLVPSYRASHDLPRQQPRQNPSHLQHSVLHWVEVNSVGRGIGSAADSDAEMLSFLHCSAASYNGHMAGSRKMDVLQCLHACVATTQHPSQ